MACNDHSLLVEQRSVYFSLYYFVCPEEKFEYQLSQNLGSNIIYICLIRDISRTMVSISQSSAETTTAKWIVFCEK